MEALCLVFRSSLPRSSTNIGVILLIFNNGAFGNVRRDQINFFEGRIHGSELRNPDFVALAHSFGAKGYKSKSPEHFRALLAQALDEAMTGPVVIENTD